MNETIQEQLAELAEFKTMLRLALKEVGGTLPVVTFKDYYKAVKDTIVGLKGFLPAEIVTATKSPISKVSETGVAIPSGFTETVTATKVVS